MRFLGGILFLALFVSALTSLVFSEVLKVRVVASQANIRLKPDLQSAVISKVPLGGILDVVKKEGEWYHIKLPADEKGIVVTGYIHQSTVEVVDAIEEKKITEDLIEKPAIKEPEPLTKAEIAKLPLSEKERYFMETDPYYPSWRQKLDQARKEQGGAKKWMWIGGGAMAVGYAIMPLLAAASLSEASTGESQQKMVTIGILTGSAGVLTMGYGWYIYLTKGRQVARIMEEGMIKGYILGLNINPKERQYAITFVLAF